MHRFIKVQACVETQQETYISADLFIRLKQPTVVRPHGLPGFA